MVVVKIHSSIEVAEDWQRKFFLPFRNFQYSETPGKSQKEVKGQLWDIAAKILFVLNSGSH